MRALIVGRCSCQCRSSDSRSDSKARANASVTSQCQSNKFDAKVSTVYADSKVCTLIDLLHWIDGGLMAKKAKTAKTAKKTTAKKAKKKKK